MFILPPLLAGAAPAPSLNWPRAQRPPSKHRQMLAGLPAASAVLWAPGSQAGPSHGSRPMAVPCGSGGRGRGVPLLFCDRSNGGAGCLGDCNMVNHPIQDLNWRICVLWKNTSTSSTAS